MTHYANYHVAKAKTLFTTPYWEYVMQWVQMKIFVFSCHFPCYNRVSVTTNIKNSGLLIRIQDGDGERAQRDENRGQIKSNFAAVLDHTENKSM